MKKISTLLFITCSFFAVGAKVRTVSNNPGSPGQYTSLQTAIDSSSAGDTIYVHGSAITYGSVTIKKRLTLIGTGNKPNKTNTLVAEVINIQLDSVAGISGASGTRIVGFKLTFVAGYIGGTKNVDIRRNYFVAGSTKINITGSGWSLTNNIISAGNVNANNNANLIIQNNIFDNSFPLMSNQATVVINNNIFTGASTGFALNNIYNALIANNIFTGPSPRAANVNNCQFNNNITYQTSADTIPFASNTGSGNLVAKNPLFTNVPTNTFNYSYDYSLSAASPGKNAGTDGKDIGVYGGTMPFADLTGTPAIPQIKSISILNPVIPAGDSLQVIIKAKKQN